LIGDVVAQHVVHAPRLGPIEDHRIKMVAVAVAYQHHHLPILGQRFAR